MAWAKGNKYWIKSVAARKENTERLQNFLAGAANNALDEYANKLDRLAQGKELTKAEREFMSRFEGWREYIAPKMRQDIDVTSKGESIVLKLDD